MVPPLDLKKTLRTREISKIMKDINSMQLDGLVSYAKELGLDSFGTKTVLLDRITRHLKQTGQWNPVDKKKRRKKAKKEQPRAVPESTDSHAEVKN